LFAGIGGFRLAADRVGLATVWANDICPRACEVYRSQFGAGVIREGDIRELLDEVPGHDLLTAGFPCQPFSSAGKKRGIRDPRGTLFHDVVQLLRIHEPAYFILENVKRLLHMERGEHFATILASLAQLDYLIEWRLLNAQHFGLPQNRQRVFVVGVRANPAHRASGRGLLPVRLAAPEDLAHLGSDDLALIGSPEEWRDLGRHAARFPNWGLAQAGRFCAAELPDFSWRCPPRLLRQVLQDHVPQHFDFTDSTRARIGGSVAVNRFVEGVEILANQAGGARMGYTVFGINGVAPTLTATASRHYERYKIGDRFRRLTNVEYARIQGFPDEHCDAVSVHRQYALFGGAVPPPMAEWVMRRLEAPRFSQRVVPRRAAQQELFANA
jgi:DNA (cytosine-5)-methyltransferase 1